MATLATETWTGADGAPWPAQWTRYTTAGTLDILGGKGRIVTPAGGYAGGIFAFLTGMAAAVNCDYTIQLTTPATLVESYVTFGIRATPNASQNGVYVPATGYYVELALSSGGLNMYRTTGTDKVGISGATSPLPTWSPSSTYKIRFSAVGSTIQVKVWLASGAEPTAWNNTTTDATWTGAGRMYIGASSGSAGTGVPILLSNLVVTDDGTTSTATLLPPTNLAATPISATQINLTWTAATGATSYDIERNAAIIASAVTGTSYSDTGLTSNTDYTYRIRSES